MFERGGGCIRSGGMEYPSARWRFVALSMKVFKILLYIDTFLGRFQFFINEGLGAKKYGLTQEYLLKNNRILKLLESFVLTYHI